MSNLQRLSSIVPMPETEAAGSAGHVQKEYEKGKAQLERRSYGEAAVSLHNALLGFEEKEDLNGVANASNQLGQLCLATEDYDGAEKHFMKARKVCEQLGDPLSLFALSKSFVEVYIGQQKYIKAVAGCLDILELYQANNDPRGAVAILEKIANIYLLQEEPVKAADTFRTVASIHRNFGHRNIADSFDKKAEELSS
ncbi:MAG: hypothetical protein CSA26_02535 [Desulfobacterales bacterium]|nr:MAG: hypothetical protein CSA26_02535 [Desulfobacterales bacterium]